MCTFVKASNIGQGLLKPKDSGSLKNDLFNTLRLIDCSALVISGKYVRQV